MGRLHASVSAREKLDWHGRTINLSSSKVGDAERDWNLTRERPLLFTSIVFVDYVEGIYVKDSPLFNFESCVNSSDKQIVLGSKKLITVWDGEVGVSYNKGKLTVSV